MIMANLNPLNRLQEWYVQQCDGTWEHTHGISISTLDNPGWRIKIDLNETNLKNSSFEEVVFGSDGKNDWYRCSVKNFSFEGYGGPMRLNDLISTFLDWANNVVAG